MKSRSYLLPLLSIFLLFTLSGCLKARATIKVEPNGSGTFGVAMGMTQQLMALASSQGANPSQQLSQELTKNINGETRNITPKRWTEGEYEWFGSDIPFKNLGELNHFAGEGELFESFSLTRKPGLLKNRFVLNARLKPLADEADIPQDTPFDTSGMFEFQMAVQLPGEVVETNGIYDNNSKSLIWTLGGAQPQEIHAVSEVWNWFNIGVTAALMVGAVVLTGGAVTAYLVVNRGQAKQPKLKKLGANATYTSPPPARAKGQSAPPVKAKPVSQNSGVKPALQPVPVSAQRKPLKRLSRPPL